MKESIVKLTLLAVLIAAGLLFTSILAAAHHSFGSTYDVQKEIELEGKVVQGSLSSPHSFFYIDVKDVTVQLQRWAIEGAGAAQFAQQGVTRDSFKIGDVVQVIGNPARSKESYRARLVKITRPSDGKSWGSRAGEVV